MPTSFPKWTSPNFVTKNIAVELILATTLHTASVVKSTLRSVDLGTVRLLPPTLTLQDHFFPDETFSPYVGAGVNYTILYDESGGIGNSPFAAPCRNAFRRRADNFVGKRRHRTC